MKKIRLAILFGGHSSEHDVSLTSAAAIISAADRARYELIYLVITPQGRWYRYHGDPALIGTPGWADDRCRFTAAILSPDRRTHGLMEFTAAGVKKIPLDVVFPVLHGKNGEDGTIQGLCALAGIPCVGCGVLASALGMDKVLAHQIAASAGIAVPKGVVLDTALPDAALYSRCERLSYPLYVKPVESGSSFGITRVENPARLPSAVALAFEHDRRVLVEEEIPGFEVGCAVLGNQELTLGEVDEIELADGFFDYTEKYQLLTAKIHTPARLPLACREQISELAARIYRLFSCRGLARIDFFHTPDGQIVFNEINTIPGFTAHSRYPTMMKQAGVGFSELIDRLVTLAMENDDTHREGAQ